MNKKGFAISIILYSLVFLLITILFMILGILKTRYNVSDNTRKSVIEGIEESDFGEVIYRKAIRNQTCMTWTDNMGTASNTDDVIYTARCNSSFNLSNYRNYVWYSGKLWRIIAIYPDKTMKLVTNDIISVVDFNGGGSFYESSIYEWLNEDFLDTLYNYNDIVADSVWNYTADSGAQPSRPESLPNQRTVTAKVGLLTAYEYMNTGSPQSDAIHLDVRAIENSYLNNLIGCDANHGSSWWFLTPGLIYYNVGAPMKRNSSTALPLGVRPSIRLKYGVKFKGTGTATDPYTIVGDKEKPIYNTTLLNTRSSGEYVKFWNKSWRIVDTENGITKIVLEEAIVSKSDVSCGSFASSPFWGGTRNATGNTYCDYYFNNIWYNAIPSNYKSMMVDGTYYLGHYDSGSYKKAICKGTVTGVTTKNCTRWSVSDNKPSDNVYYAFVGKVGLPRVGEMFSSIVHVTENPYLISPYSSKVNSLDGYDVKKISPTDNNRHAYHLTITLSSSVKITDGSGTEYSPFEISL